MLHIKSKVMKSRIQWCKNFALGTCIGVTRGQKVDFGSFLCTCVAWQTHRDHVVRLLCCRRQRRCRQHTFPFRSVTFEGMYWFHSNFAELYITIKYRSSLILVIIRQILAELLPFFWLSFCCLFLLSNFWRDALISFKLCRTLYHC